MGDSGIAMWHTYTRDSMHMHVITYIFLRGTYINHEYIEIENFTMHGRKDQNSCGLVDI